MHYVTELILRGQQCFWKMLNYLKYKETRMSWRYAPVILAPSGGSVLGLRPKPVMPVTERRPCVHASTLKFLALRAKKVQF